MLPEGFKPKSARRTEKPREYEPRYSFWERPFVYNFIHQHLGWVLGLSLIVLVCFLLGQKPASKVEEAAPAKPAEPYVRKPVVWDSYSDGWTWYSATHEERMELCRKLAGESYNGSSAQFFYDAFQEFYTTSYNEPNTKGQKINDMARLFQAGGNALPRSRRNY